MPRRSYRGNEVVKEKVSERVDEFDSRVLEDWMHTVDDGDELVYYFAEAIGNAWYANDEADGRYGWDDEIAEAVGGAAEELGDAFDAHLDVLVAETCATVALRNGKWVEHHDDEDIEAAVHEAREWLQEHSEAAERAGVWEEVTA
ncbi:hypothetical protein [Natrinema ejinorense]|uniref:Uncharacterized protein n=1 Tax=Natrinema ejinorense TaxID=373386 RepID=A0A2A5QRA4_9EURY|nr:hypothetical protein [Natrinema ejinorense]PCR89334.1 hypothetical protein CP557_01545 [Natrinema ejinorense]